MSDARGVIVLGSGKRVRETALPALESLAGSYEVRSIFARTAKEITSAGKTWRVRPIGELDAAEVAAAALVYVAVGKEAVPEVLARLARYDRSRLRLLIDTPVVRIKHFRHAALLDGFRAASVAEDTAFLPWYDTVRAAVAAGRIGELRRVVFERSAYAYHGLAMAKSLLESDRIVRARRTKLGGKDARREVELANGRVATMLEPRDYATGRVVIEGSRGAIGDGPAAGEDRAAGQRFLRLETVVVRGACAGFRIGEHETRLAPEEVELAHGGAPEATVVARMDALKRVGFRRLLAEIDAGRSGYPVEQALDDMVVDYFVERFGVWRPTPLTDVRSGLARRVWGFASRFAG